MIPFSCFWGLLLWSTLLHTPRSQSLDICGGASEDAINGRQELCSRARNVTDGLVALDASLRGVHLRFGTGFFSEQFLAFDTRTGMYSGLEHKILQALAGETGMTYDLIQHNWSTIDSWSTALYETICLYDMITFGYWTITSDRALNGNGALSPYGYLDHSYIMVSLKKPVQDGIFKTASRIGDPFTSGVWISVLILIVTTSAVYWLVEDHRKSEEGEVQSGLQSCYDTSLAITGIGASSPKTWPGKLVLMSWAIYIVIFIAAYTANLASLLVVQKTSAIPISTVRQAILRKTRICVYKGGALAEWFSKEHPDYPHLIQVSPEKGDTNLPAMSTFPRLRQGDCEIVITETYVYDIVVKDAKLNVGCDMVVLGRTIVPRYAGFMVMGDYSTKCTTLVRDVLQIAFLKLVNKGFLAKLMAEFSDSFTPKDFQTSCQNIDEVPITESQAIDLNGMAGALALYAVGTCSGILIWLSVEIRARVRGSSPATSPPTQIGVIEPSNEEDDVDDLIMANATRENSVSVRLDHGQCNAMMTL